MGDEDSLAEGGLPEPRLGIGRDAGKRAELCELRLVECQGNQCRPVSTTGKPNCSAMR